MTENPSSAAPALDVASNATGTLREACTLPLAMAAIPDALEGMQLSQDFTGSAQQLQADMDALRLSLETLDFGKDWLTIAC